MQLRRAHKKGAVTERILHLLEIRLHRLRNMKNRSKELDVDAHYEWDHFMLEGNLSMLKASIN